MKQILLIIFIIINVSNLKSQTFNGKIIYEANYPDGADMNTQEC